MNQDLLQNSLEVSFDAGILVQGREEGTILYANEVAQELFGSTIATDTKIAGKNSKNKTVDAWVSFWTFSSNRLEVQQQNSKDTMTWSEVIGWIGQTESNDMIPDEWIISGTSRGSNHKPTSFPGVLKVKRVDNDNDLYLCYVRHSDHHDATHASSSARSTTSRISRRTARRVSTASTILDASSEAASSDPMMAIDQTGTILMFNQAAVESVDWCSEEWVGKSLVEAMRGTSGHAALPTKSRTTTDTVHRKPLISNDMEAFTSNEPSVTVDEEGIILSVSTSATERISWCHREAVGQHLSRLGARSSKEESQLPATSIQRRWPFWQHHHRQQTQDASSVINKPSPQVLRIYIRPTDDTSGHCTAGADPFAVHPTETLTVSSDVQQRESILAAVFDASLDPLFQINEHGVIQMVNAAATRLFGWSQSDFLGSNISMICGGPHGSKHSAYMARYLATGETRVLGRKRELTALRQDGSEFPIELAVVEADTSLGDERLFCGFVRDLSTLKRKERLTGELVEASLDPMFQITESGRITMVNEAAVKKFGWTRDELIGSNINIICGGFHAKNHDMYMKRYLSTGEARVIGKNRELPARHKDGSEFQIELAVVELKTKADEERKFCGYVHDLSARNKMDTILRGILDIALDPLLMINEHGIIQLANNAAEQQLGWSKSELLGENISLICGGEHAKHHDKYLQHFLKTGETRAIGKKRELLARRQDGSEFPMELALCELDVRAHGEDERLFCGFMRDLTNQKEYEHEIERREAFTNKIIEASPDSLFVINARNRIVRVNEAAVAKFGWTAVSLDGMPLQTVMTTVTSSEVAAEIDAFLTAGVPLTKEKEAQGIMKDGTVFPVSLRTAAVKGPAQEDCFAIYAEDLTDKKRRMQVEIEKAAAEVLLFNVLPEHIADRLRANPSHIAESHSDAAILFADIVGFTSMSNNMKPEEVVSMLNELFSMFDDLVEQYHPLTKIKTIGDCYMATIVPQKQHLLDVSAANCATICHFALDMLEALEKYNMRHPDRKLSLRVGINSGEVVAGVVGTKRFLYDLWGDAVNLASRMESTGVPGKIQITPHVAELLEDDFFSEKRGMVHVKGIGELETFFLLGRKTRPFKSPVKRQEDKEYTLVVDDGSQMDFARSLRVLELSERDRPRPVLSEGIGDESANELTGEQVFEYLKRKGEKSLSV